MVTTPVPQQALGGGRAGGSRDAWEPLDRSGHLDALLSHLDGHSPRAALVVGATGTGKRTLLDLLARRLGAGRAYLIDGAEPVAVRQVADVARAAAAELAGPGARPKPAFLICDVDLLDAGSRSLLDHLLARTEGRLVGAVRSHRLPALLSEVPAWRRTPQLMLEPLSLEGTAAWCAVRLNGQLDPMALHAVHAVSGGLTLLVREAVEQGLAQGTLTRRAGRWELADCFTRLSWPESIHGLLDDLAPRQRGLVSYLGVARMCDLATAERLFGARAVGALEAAALVELQPSGGRQSVLPQSPWTAALFRHATAGPHLDATAQAYLDELGRRRLTGDDFLALAELAEERRITVDPDHRARLTKAALAGGDVRAARAVTTAAGRNDELNAMVLSVAGQHGFAEEVFREADAPLPRLVNLVLGLGDVATALTIDGGAAGSALCRAVEGMSVAVPHTAGGMVGGLTDQVQLLAFTESALRDGRAAQALILSRFEAVEPQLAGPLRLRRAELLLAVGRDADAEAEAGELERTAVRTGNRSLLASALVLRGELAVRRGRPHDARRIFIQALVEGERSEAHQPLVVGASRLAVALAWLGEGVAAESALTRAAQAMPRHRAPRSRETLELARIETMLIRGAVSSAVQRARELADQAEATGAWAVAVAALTLAGRARLDSDLVERLTVASARCDHVGWSVASYVTAIARQDAAALDDAARTFQSAGWLLQAAEANAQSAAAWEGSGRRAQAKAASGRCAALLETAGVPRPLFWPATPAAMRLTTREREIALLAARGVTSAQIGRQLHVSIRTVENHLQHAYRKLGIDSRRELVGALGAAMTDPGQSGTVIGRAQRPGGARG